MRLYRDTVGGIHMDITEAMHERHSVRKYTDKKIEEEKAKKLKCFIEKVNAESGLHIQLVLNEPEGFSGAMAHYGSFSGARNYIVMAGKKGLDREIGYYGEKVVLFSQMLGLNTCWVALTFNRRKAVYKLDKGEKMYVVISLGYGVTGGKPHTSKPVSEIAKISDNCPEWYKKGIDGVLLAPTAVNQQKFFFSLDGERVTAVPGKGFYTDMDLGIAMYHFDAATGKSNFGMKL